MPNLQWSAHSFALSSIEKFWGVLSETEIGLENQFDIMQEPTVVLLLKEWEKISTDFINCDINALAKGCLELVLENGAKIQYLMPIFSV